MPPRASAADIVKLRGIHGRLIEARNRTSYANILLANQQFHLELCRCARRPVLLRLVEALWVQCGPLMHGLAHLPAGKLRPHPHVAIIEALRARDGDRAREAMCQDIVISTDALLLYLTNHADRPDWAHRFLPDTSTALQTRPPQHIAGSRVGAGR
jgi:DNA-binding GntR family transcriptional regulator